MSERRRYDNLDQLMDVDRYHDTAGDGVDQLAAAGKTAVRSC